MKYCGSKCERKQGCLFSKDQCQISNPTGTIRSHHVLSSVLLGKSRDMMKLLCMNCCEKENKLHVGLNSHRC